jgi:Tol biopolymer transport system component
VSKRAKWAIGAIFIAVSLVAPAAALAVFPGENGKIAFVSGRNGGDAQADVYLLEAAGDLTPTPLTSAAGQHRHPAWSPDLSQVAYAL